MIDLLECAAIIGFFAAWFALLGYVSDWWERRL